MFPSSSVGVMELPYLVKPATQGSIANMLARLNLDRIEKAKVVTLPDGHSLIARKILYTEYFNHVVSIHLEGGNVYRQRTSHSQIEELLIPLGYFCSPNKGVIVNLHEITNANDNCFTMTDGQVLPISRRKSKEIQATYIKFCFDKMRKDTIT